MQRPCPDRSSLPRLCGTRSDSRWECQTLDVKSSATEPGVREETACRLVRRKVLRKLPGLRRVLIPCIELDQCLNNGNPARLS